MSEKRRRFFLTLMPALVLLGAWEWSVAGSARLQFLFASPSLVAHVAVQELTGGAIWRHFGVTAGEAVLGLCAGSLLGTLAGLALWGNGKLEAIARPYVVVLGAIPVFALAPMLIIWFGIGLLSKVVMAAFGCFFVSLIQAFEGARRAARDYSGFARSVGASRVQIVRKIIVPGALEWLCTGIKVNVGFALLGAFIGEFVSSEAGLGYYTLAAGALYDMPRVIFGLALLSLFALSLTGFVGWLTGRMAPWLRSEPRRFSG